MGTSYSNSITVDHDDMTDGTLTALTIAGTSNNFGACAQVTTIEPSTSIQATAASGTIYGIKLNEFGRVETSYATIRVDLGDASTQDSEGMAVGVWNDGYYNTSDAESGASSYQVNAGENAVAMGFVNAADKNTSVGALITSPASVGNLKVVISASSTANDAINSNYDFASVGIWNQDVSLIGNIDSISNISASAATNAGAAIGIKNDGSITSSGAAIKATNTAGIAYGIDNSGEITTLTGSITAEAQGTASAIKNSGDTSRIGCIIDADITATSQSGAAQGIANEGRIGDISGTITVNGVNDSEGISNGFSYLDGKIDVDLDVSATNAATGIKNLGAINGTISGNFTVHSETGVAKGISSTYNWISDVNVNMNVTSGTGNAYGIFNDAKTGNIAGSITVEGGESQYPGMAKAYGIYSNDDGDMGEISANLTVSTVNSQAFGINNSGTIESINIDSASIAGEVYSIKVTCDGNSGSTTGIDNSGIITNGIRADIISQSGASAMGLKNTGTIGGDVTLSLNTSGRSSSYGINNSGTIEGVSTVKGSVTSSSSSAYAVYNSKTMGDVILDTSMTSSGTSSSNKIAGVYNKGAMGDISGSINVAATGALKAYGIELTSDATVGTINTTINASSNTGNAYGIYTASSNALNLGDGASISAESAEGKAYSIYSTGDLSIAAQGTAKLNGDVSVKADGSGALTLGSGTVTVSEGSTIQADSITIDSGANLALVIAGNDTISSSSVANNGTLSLSAGTGLAADEYSLSANSDLTVDGTVKTYGGTLSGNTFTVSQAKSLTLNATTEQSGATVDLNGRLIVTADAESGDDTTITMNFSSTNVITVNAVTTVTTATTVGDFTIATNFSDYVESTLVDSTIQSAAAYYFDVANMTEGVDSVELVFNVGAMGEDVDIAIFHLDDQENATWTDITESANYSYDGENLYVIADGFSSYGYSLSRGSAVPEPSTATLSLLALAGLCARRRRKA